MKPKRISAPLLKVLGKLIEREVGYFNGWAVSEELERRACQKAAEKVWDYLEARRQKLRRRATCQTKK